MTGSSIFLTSTLLDDPGKIVKKNKHVSHFFEYNEKEFESINHIN